MPNVEDEECFIKLSRKPTNSSLKILVLRMNLIYDEFKLNSSHEEMWHMCNSKDINLPSGFRMETYMYLMTLCPRTDKQPSRDRQL